MSVSLWDVLTVAVKALLYAATLGSAGGVMFLCYSRALLGAKDEHAMLRHIEIGVMLAVLASALRIMVSAGSLAGAASGMFDPSLVHLVWHSGEDGAVILRVAGLLLAVQALGARGGAPGRGAPRLASGTAFAVIGACCAALSFAWVGHAHATRSWWVEGSMAVHLVAAAFWIGALVPLSQLAKHGDPARLAAPAARFGSAAMAVVALLMLAGLAVLCRLLGSAGALWSSAYGRTACVKLTLVAGLLGLAAYNKLRLTPRLIAGDRQAVALLARSIRGEIVLAASILAATAALTTLAGAPGLG